MIHAHAYVCANTHTHNHTHTHTHTHTAHSTRTTQETTARKLNREVGGSTAKLDKKDTNTHKRPGIDRTRKHQKRSRKDYTTSTTDFQFSGKSCSHRALQWTPRGGRRSKFREILQRFGSVTFYNIKVRSNLAKKFMIIFWPNFDVRKEQISNAKREHGQTDAENAYKTATIARDRPKLRHRKEQNECRISLKTVQHKASRGDTL